MEYKQPERLTTEQFMPLSAPFQIFRHSLTDHVNVHWHEFYEMALVVSGFGTHKINGMDVPISRGSFFLLTPADFHAITPHPGQIIELYDVIFSENYIRDELKPLLFLDPGEHACDFAEELFLPIEAEFMRLWNECRQLQVGGEFVIQGTLDRIFIDFVRKKRVVGTSLGKSSETPTHAAIRKSLIYIQHHFREPITLQDAAKYAQLSPNYYSECFTKMFRFSFQKHLLDLRLQFAKSLLRVSHSTVTDIAFASGFNSLPHFERMFKRKYQQSPRGYRTTIINQ